MTKVRVLHENARISRRFRRILISLMSILANYILYISTSLAMSTSDLKALSDKLDIKRHSPGILYISTSLAMSTSDLKAWPDKLDIKRLSPGILYLLFLSSTLIHYISHSVTSLGCSVATRLFCTPVNTPPQRLHLSYLCLKSLLGKFHWTLKRLYQGLSRFKGEERAGCFA